MRRNNELFDYIMHIVQEQLQGKVSTEEAHAIAQATVLKLSHDFGGNEFYISKEVARQEKYQMICREFNGRNVGTLARKYHLSERRIEIILADGRKRNQPELF